jgi:hypothetical protein
MQVKLADELYQQAQRRASEAGYASVDEYIAGVLTHELSDEPGDDENLDHLFTPEFLAHLDTISAEMHAGKSVSMEEIDQHLADVRKAWLKNRAG